MLFGSSWFPFSKPLFYWGVPHQNDPLWPIAMFSIFYQRPNEKGLTSSIRGLSFQMQPTSFRFLRPRPLHRPSSAARHLGCLHPAPVIQELSHLALGVLVASSPISLALQCSVSNRFVTKMWDVDLLLDTTRNHEKQRFSSPKSGFWGWENQVFDGLGCLGYIQYMSNES